MRFKNGVIPALVALTAIGGVVGMSHQALAVGGATTADAQIKAPITVTAIQALNFGVVIPDAVNPGTVVITAAAAPTVTHTTVVDGGGTQQAARFNLTGELSTAYTLDVNAGGGALTIISGANSMTVDTWTDNNTGFDGLGAATLYIGGTLNVAGAQPVGTYTAALNIDVVY